MSLCNTNWKELLSGETHQPDVDFIVHDEDGERVVSAHRYLLAIVSPVFKEQFYGENGENDLEEACGRIKICLDSSYNAVEAFFKYIYEKCFVNLAFNDLFELLRLSERFQMEKMSIDIKEFIVKFIVDNKEQTVEEIIVMKKVEKDFKDKLSHISEKKNSLEHISQQYKKELKEKNEKLEQALVRTISFEHVEGKLKQDIDGLQKDRNILTEDNNKLKNDMINLQKEQEILIEDKVVLVEQNKALMSQLTDFALEKEKMNDFCVSLTCSNELKMSNNQTENVGDKLIDNTQAGCSTSKSERVEVEPETNFEVKENNAQWSYTEGNGTLISIPISEDCQILELENKSTEEKLSTTKETCRKALPNSNARRMTITDEKKLLEEETEAIKIARAQIGFLNKEIESLKLGRGKEESGNIPAETSRKETENKASPRNKPAVTSLNQPLIEINPKVNPNQQKMINGELADVKKTLSRKKEELKQLIGDIEDKNKRLIVRKDELKNINKELTEIEETLACKKKELETSLAEKDLHAAIKSLNEDKKKLEKENKQLKSAPLFSSCRELNSSTSISVSPVAKKSRLSFALSDKGEESEDLRMSLDQRKIRRVLAKNVESGNPDVSDGTAVDDDELDNMSLGQRKIRRVLAKNVESGNPDVNDGTAVDDDELDNFITIEIKTENEEADEIEEGEYVESTSGRSASNSPWRTPTPLQKTQSTRCPARQPQATRSPARQPQSTRSPARQPQSTRSPARQTQAQRSRSPRIRSTPYPSDKSCRSPTASSRNEGNSTLDSRNEGNRTLDSRNRKSSPRIRSSSPKKRSHSSEVRRSSPPSKRPLKVKEEIEYLTKIQVTVQREGFHSTPDNTHSSVSHDRGKTNQQKGMSNQMGENVDDYRSRRFPEDKKMSIEKERMRIITMEEEKLKQKFRKRKQDRLVEQENEKKSHDERDGRIPLDDSRSRVEHCGKGKVFLRLGGKARY